MRVRGNFICRNYLKNGLKLRLSRKESSLLLTLDGILPTCNSTQISQLLIFLTINPRENWLVVIYSRGRFIYPHLAMFFPW